MTSYKKGDRVTACFDDVWYAGIVTMNRDGKVYVLFDDGDKNTYSPRSKLLMHVVGLPKDEPAKPEEPEPEREPMQVPPETDSHRHVIPIHHLDELDKLIARMEALRKVATTCGGRRYIRFPTGMDGHELVLQVDLTATALDRTTERRNADGSTGYVTLDPPKRKATADEFTDRVHDAPLRRGRRAPSRRST